MKTFLLAALIALLATPAFAHDYRPYRERSYSYPRHQTYTHGYSYDRPSTYRSYGDRGRYGSYSRPRYHRHWRDGSTTSSKRFYSPGRRWR